MISSETFRKHGNALYTEFKTEGLAPLIRISRAQQALQNYRKAYDYATNQLDKLKAMKNIGVTSFALSTYQGFTDRQSLDACWALFLDAVKMLSSTFESSLSTSDLVEWEWIIHIFENLGMCIEKAIQFLVDVIPNDRMKLAKLERLMGTLTHLSTDSVRHVYTICYLHYKKAELLVNSIAKLEDTLDAPSEDWPSAVSIMKDLLLEINILKSGLTELEANFTKVGFGLSNLYTLQSNVSELLDRYSFYAVHLGAIELRANATRVFQRGVMDAESIELDLVWESVDLLNASIKVACPDENSSVVCKLHQDFEQQIISKVHLARIYCDVLKDDVKAKHLLVEALRTAQMVTDSSGKVFFDAPWHVEARTTISTIDERKEAAETAEYNALRDELKVKLQPELDAIKASMNESSSSQKQLYDLMKFVLGKHPPKLNSEEMVKFKKSFEELDKDKSDCIKKFFSRRFILHYHPDKVNKKDDHGKEWLVLCEEISSYGNRLYSNLKGV